MTEKGLDRSVSRDEVIGDARTTPAGRGTYVEGDTIRALFDGTATSDQHGRLVVTRPRKPLPRARAARRPGPDSDGPRVTPNTREEERGGRHGAGKHGKPGGRPRRSRGDQGTWN